MYKVDLDTDFLLQIIPDEFDIKIMIEEILSESGYADSRAAKMDVDDLLKSVYGFL